MGVCLPNKYEARMRKYVRFSGVDVSMIHASERGKPENHKEVISRRHHRP